MTKHLIKLLLLISVGLATTGCDGGIQGSVEQDGEMTEESGDVAGTQAIESEQETGRIDGVIRAFNPSPVGFETATLKSESFQVSVSNSFIADYQASSENFRIDTSEDSD